MANYALMFAMMLVFIAATLNGCNTDQEDLVQETAPSLPSEPSTPTVADYHIGIVDQCEFDENKSISWSCNETHFTTVRDFDRWFHNAGISRLLERRIDLFAFDERDTSCQQERALRSSICNVSQATFFHESTRADVFAGMLENRKTPKTCSCGQDSYEGTPCDFKAPVNTANTCSYSYKYYQYWPVTGGDCQGCKKTSTVREFACQPSEGTFSLSRVEVGPGETEKQTGFSTGLTCHTLLPPGRSCADQLELFVSFCENITETLADGVFWASDPYDYFLSDQWFGPSRRLRSAPQRSTPVI